MLQTNNRLKMLRIGLQVVIYMSLEVEKYANENVVRVLVGNKVDLESKREVTPEEGKELADSLNVRFIGMRYLSIKKHLPKVLPMWKKHLLHWLMKSRPRLPKVVKVLQLEIM